MLWDNVKDEEGYRAVFTEQGASASQTAEAKFLDTISKLKQVTQVQRTLRSRWPKLPGCYDCQKTNVQRYRSGFIHDKDQKIAIRLTILWLAPPERNLDGHPLAGQLWERHVEEVLNRNGWEKVPTWECLCAHKELGSFLSVNVDDPTLVGQKAELKKRVENLQKDINLEDPTPSGCTQREAKVTWQFSQNRFVQTSWRRQGRLTKKIRRKTNIRHKRFVLGAMTWKVMQKKCVERYCELAKTNVSSLQQVPTPCIDDHLIMKQLGSSLPYVLRCKMLVFGKNWTTELLWSVNTQARSETKWNKARDKILLRLINWHQSDRRLQADTVMRVIVMKIANLVCSSMLHLQMTCETPNQRQEVYCARSDHKRLFQFSWMRKRQSAAFHSSAESEIISLDAGLWMDGYQRFNFGNVCVGSVSSKPAWASQTRKSHSV